MAPSPQAKGKIERLFGTLQKRLVTLFAYEKVRDHDHANQLLADEITHYNQSHLHRTTGLTPNQAWDKALEEKRTKLKPVPIATLLNLHFALHLPRRVSSASTVEFLGETGTSAPPNKKASCSSTTLKNTSGSSFPPKEYRPGPISLVLTPFEMFPFDLTSISLLNDRPHRFTSFLTHPPISVSLARFTGKRSNNMAQNCFHPSIEGAQHGAKSLPEFLDYAKKSGAAGAQPSNYMLQADKGFQKAKDIKKVFDDRGMKLDGVSAHCPFWVHTTAWTGSPTVRPFLPPDVAKKSPADIEKWAEDYLLQLLDLCGELGVKIVPMFWGVAFGWEMATGYPWGFWKGGDYDMLEEGKERFIKKTQKIRDKARSLGIYIAHEIHPGTAAMCADDFNMLVKACDGDKVLVVNADPSHCWEGEHWETRFRKVAERVYACHVKNYVIRPNVPLRYMAGDWPNRAMQFVDIPSGDLNMLRYVEMLIGIGYPQRYCQIMGTDSAPLIVEAESAYRDVDATSSNGIAYTRDHLCFPIAKGSFEEGMGA